MYVCVPYWVKCLQGSEGIGFPSTEVTDGWEPQCGCQELNHLSRPLIFTFCVYCVYFCVPVCGAKGGSRVPFFVALYLTVSQGLSLSLRSKDSARLVGQKAPGIPTHLCLSSTEIIGIQFFFVSAEDPHSVPHACTAKTFLNKTSRHHWHQHYTHPSIASSGLGLRARNHHTQLLKCQYC